MCFKMISPSLQSIFTLMLGPFVFFDAQKTKYLQILTSLMRWIGKSNLSYLKVYKHHRLIKVALDRLKACIFK